MTAEELLRALSLGEAPSRPKLPPLDEERFARAFERTMESPEVQELTEAVSNEWAERVFAIAREESRDKREAMAAEMAREVFGVGIEPPRARPDLKLVSVREE